MSCVLWQSYWNMNSPVLKHCTTGNNRNFTQNSFITTSFINLLYQFSVLFAIISKWFSCKLEKFNEICRFGLVVTRWPWSSVLGSTWTGDHQQMGKISQYVTSHSGQLSLGSRKFNSWELLKQDLQRCCINLQYSFRLPFPERIQAGTVFRKTVRNEEKNKLFCKVPTEWR